MTHFPPAPSRPLRCALQTLLAAGLLGLLSLETQTLFLFPALGASTFIVFSFPHLPAARPRNVVGAHVVGAAAGWLCFRAFGLHPGGPTLAAGGGLEHVAAAALALGLTTALLLKLDLLHPPAGATTLLVSLGVLPHAWQIAMVGASALMLVLLARLFALLDRPPARASESATPNVPMR